MNEQSQDQGLGENDSRTEAKKKRTVQRTGSSMVVHLHNHMESLANGRLL